MFLINRIPILAILIVVSLISCSTENNNQRVVGKWQGVTWKVKGQPSGRNATEVVFEFLADDSYTTAFGKQKEAGAFRLIDKKLYTTATGQAEKMVEIHFPTLDTMVMDMNRAGTMEELVLAKQ